MRRALRGLRYRGASTALLVLLAVVAAAAAAAVPSYETAARTAILRTELAATPGSDNIEVTTSTGGPAPLIALVGGQLAELLAPSNEARVLAAPVASQDVTVSTGGPGFVGYLLVSRTGVCGHLTLLSGHCPAGPGQVVASALDASNLHDHTGTTLRLSSKVVLHVVGVYAEPNPQAPAWFEAGPTYFPQAQPGSTAPASGPATDALFALPSTVAPLAVAGSTTNIDDIAIRTGALTPGGLARLDTAVGALESSTTLSNDQAVAVSQFPAAAAQARAGWSSLDVPALLIAAELVVLVWMLLFLVVTEDVGSRGGEVALARLRGATRRRVVGLAVGEPVVVLLAAVPLGVLLGWLAARLLAARELTHAPAPGVPALTVAAAAVAVLGGLAAAMVAARGVLARGVLDQWQRTHLAGTRRSWVLDAMLLAFTVAGLVDLFANGVLSSASRSLLVELVPGLLGLLAALVASRLLPPACRALAARRPRAPLPGFLALRHVGRRPAGARTMVVLASAIALATFATAAWSVGRDDRQLVASVRVGAPTVLTVTTRPSQDLAAVVDEIDPSGRRAVAVDNYDSSGGPTLLAVQPSRFAAVASWGSSSSRARLSDLAARLEPPVAAPVTVTGSALRITYRASSTAASVVTVTPDVDISGSGVQPVQVGAPVRVPTPAGARSAAGAPRDARTLRATGPLPDCPCRLDNIQLSSAFGFTGRVQLIGLAERRGSHWRPVASFTRPGEWASSVDERSFEHISAGPSGLTWVFNEPPSGPVQINVADHPAALPAVGTSTDVPAGAKLIEGIGLSGSNEFFQPVGTVSSVPGAPANGLVVDQTYALRAAGELNLGAQQVWIAAGDAAAIEAGLRARGVVVTATQTTAAALTLLDQQGPALASSLLLVDSGVAAALAAVAAATALAVAARRRRREYVALIASGAGRGVVWRSLVFEQALVLGFAAIVGVAAGVVGAVLALPKVPVLETVPAAPALSFTPSAGVLAVAVACVLLVLAAAAAASSITLVRSVGPQAVRESGL